MNPATLMKLGLGSIAAFILYKVWESKQKPKPSEQAVPPGQVTPISPSSSAIHITQETWAEEPEPSLVDHF
jgi:hypothetical protein